MKLRFKTSLLLGLVIFSVISAFYFFSQQVLLASFIRLEEAYARQNLLRAVSALDNEISFINSTAGDYAGWDNTYEFIQHPHAHYIQNDIAVSAFLQLNLNYMLFYDRTGRLVYARGVDLQSGREEPPPASLLQHLAQNTYLLQHPSPLSSKKGILMLPEGPLLLASRPIVTSELQGPVRGTLLVARWLDTDKVKELAEKTRLHLTISTPDELSQTGEAKDLPGLIAAGQTMCSRPLDSYRLAGYAVLKDFYHQPVLLLKVVLPREIYRQGKQTLRYFLLGLLALGLAFYLLSMFFLEKTILSRLAGLRTAVNNIGLTGDLSARVKVPGRDEISDLAGKINEMLAALELSRNELRASNEQFRRLSLYDTLTGLTSRTGFQQEMQRLEKEPDLPLAVVVCDVNNLKTVNDSLGHEAGDRLLQTAAGIISQTFADWAGRIVARLGGDEFAVVLPGADREAVQGAVQRLEQNVAAYNQHGNTLPLSISCGFAVQQHPGERAVDLYKAADDMMYRQKLLQKQNAASTIFQAVNRALEIKDFLQQGHAERLQEIMYKMAGPAGLPEQALDNLRLLARYHDIGKVGVPDSILFKPGPLVGAELAEMRRHCETGYRIAQAIPELQPVAEWILKHHEWWNGQGYPLGLRGEEIPLPCRLLAIADAYDAMTSHQPYRPALSPEHAAAEIKRCAGTQFDPALAELFLTAILPELPRKC
ncbi:MAG: CHASE4 domain-containing protein [Desulfurispora sp.]|uniref:CHASE4 domain-containing protein n=1 Tax=Desulfurispora sp. TaxID=3014275 RepID=UPI00404B51C7